MMPPHEITLRLYTPDEAAERLRITRRKAIILGKRFGLCSVTGRTVLFTEKDLLDLVEAMRFQPTSAIGERYASAFRGKRAYDVILAKITAQQQARQQRIDAARRERAAERQAKVEEAARLRDEKRAARENARKTKSAPPVALSGEVLDRKNRDPAYWTEERKLRLREERVARMKAHAIETGSSQNTIE